MPKVDDFRSIDIAWLRRRGVRNVGYSGRIICGGRRHWFACPSCARRCRILYGGSHFRCRICRGARYESQYQHAAFSTGDRRWRIRKQLEERGGREWPWGLDDGFPPKPPHMRWRTYRIEVSGSCFHLLSCTGATQANAPHNDFQGFPRLSNGIDGILRNCRVSRRVLPSLEGPSSAPISIYFRLTCPKVERRPVRVAQATRNLTV